MTTRRAGSRSGSSSGALLTPLPSLADADVDAPDRAPGTFAARRGAPATTVVSAMAAVGALAAVVALAGLVDSGALTPSAVSGLTVVVAALGIVAGIPHGAADHVVALRLAGSHHHERGSVRELLPRLLVILAAYLLIAAVAATAFVVTPDVSVALFFLVAAVHFGWGELTFAAERAGRRSPTIPRDLPATVVYASVLVGLPMASTQSRDATAMLAPGLARELSEMFDVLPGGTVTIPTGFVSVSLPVLVAVAGAVVGLAVARLRAGRSLEAVEISLLAALFASAPPLIAFGVYFGGWHALRHTRRLLEVLAPGARRGRQVAAFVRAAALPTVGAFATLALLWSLRAHQDIVVVGMSILLALTFPHAVVVSALDRRGR